MINNLLESLPTSIETTLSPVLRDIPLTPPAALRLVGKSSTEKRIPIPCSDTKIMSSDPLASLTETNSSSSFRFIIISPDGLMCSTSCNLILLTLPLVVPKTKYSYSSYCFFPTATMALICSVSQTGTILATGTPLVFLPMSARSSYPTFDRTLPLLVKNIILS